LTRFNTEWKAKFGWPCKDVPDRPLAIAHRGASGHRTENSLDAFVLASDLFAEMWELDVHLSADGKAVVSHDDDLTRTTGHNIRISEATWADICALRLPGGQAIPSLDDVIDLAITRGAGLYIEAKSEGAAEASWHQLERRNHRYAAIGSFNPRWIAELRRMRCCYPLSVLVPSNVDPFAYSAGTDPDILHLCWREASPTPQDLVTKDLVARCHAAGTAVVLWHEDRREVLDGLEGLPILGICSDRPETLKPYRIGGPRTPALVCHRGANFVAPENTLEAARICIDQGFQYVEIDVCTSADGELVVLHDATLERTTDGVGPVASKSLAEIKALDAGNWKAPLYSGLRVPTLGEVLEMAKDRIGVYIEVKDAEPKAVLREVTSRNMLDQVFFWCADRTVLFAIKDQFPEAQLMAPRRMYASLDATIEDYDADIIEFEFGQDDLSEVAECAARGVQSMILCVSHDPADLSEVLSHHPDLINADRPDILKILHSYPDLISCSMTRSEADCVA